MTKLAHTPGPWGRHHDHPNPETAIDVAYIRSETGEDYVGEIAIIFGCDYKDGNQSANANLIAAAPDMYSALQTALRQLTVAVNANGGDAETHNGCNKIRAAIDKAGGRS